MNRKPKTKGGDAAIPVPRKLKVPQLSASAKAWAAKLAGEYDIRDAGGAAILNVAARALDRAEQAAAILHRDGLTTVDRYGALKVHPCCQIERSARQSIITALRALRLDMEPSNAMGRPADALHWRPSEEDEDE